MVETINKLGYEGKIGIQVDVAADTYWEESIGRYVGIFSDEPKTKDDLFKLYQLMVKEYPFVILEDPLDEDDYEGTADPDQRAGHPGRGRRPLHHQPGACAAGHRRGRGQHACCSR